MPTIKCPYCAEDIVEGALKCKHCKSNLAAKTISETSTATTKCHLCGGIIDNGVKRCRHCGADFQKEKAKKSANNMTVGCLIIVAVLIAIAFIFSSGGGGTDYSKNSQELEDFRRTRQKAKEDQQLYQENMEYIRGVQNEIERMQGQ